MQAERFNGRLIQWTIAVVVIMQLPCGSCFGQRATTSGETETGIHLTADAKGTGIPLVHFWSKVVGAGRANEGLRATWQEEMATAGKYDGFQYIRFHGIFHDDMWVYREDNSGKPIYNFQYIDDLYDRMLEKGIRPFVELGF
jgi:xylan 1,4-beta-xylosidase